MKKPIIPIKRAPESWTMALIKLGVLKITNKGLKVVEK